MKKFLYFMMAGGLMATLSCSSDDDGNNNNDNDNLPEATVYKITSWTSPIAQDLDDDGDSSADLITEFDCYSEWTITLNSDNTFTRTYNVIATLDGVLTCQSDMTSAGTWVRDGQTLTLTNTDLSDFTETFNFSADDEILTGTGPGEYPIVFEGVVTLEPGTVTTVYLREEDIVQQ